MRLSIAKFLPIPVIGLSSALALRLNYFIGDGFSTPLRALYIAKYESLDFLDRISQFTVATVHNDSVKLFPSLIELLFFQIKGHWSPAISISIGIISWISCYLLIVKLVQENTSLTEKEKALFISFIALSMFCPSHFFLRFTQVFVIHRTLVAICVLVIANILFKKENLLTTNKRTAIISICCIISQFSFANGFTIWFLILAGLILKELYPKININPIKVKYFVLACLTSNSFYLILFDNSHTKALASVMMSKLQMKDGFSLGLELFANFSTNYMSSFNSNFFIGKTFSFSVLLIIYILIINKFLKNNKSNVKIEKLVNLLPFIFIGTFYGLPILGRLFLRYEPISSRYFVESTLFSISILVIIYSMSKATGVRNISSFLLTYVLVLSSLNLMNIVKYVQDLNFPDSHAREVELIKCIKSSSEVSYKKCLTNDFTRKHLGGDIDNRSIELFKVFNQG